MTAEDGLTITFSVMAIIISIFTMMLNSLENRHRMRRRKELDGPYWLFYRELNMYLDTYKKTDDDDAH